MFYILYDGEPYAGPYATVAAVNRAFAKIKDPELYTIEKRWK